MNTGIILFSNAFLKNFSQVRMNETKKKDETRGGKKVQTI